MPETGPDIRWRQRLDHYGKALAQLCEGVALLRQRPLSRLERQGLIKAFEFTHELAWNTLRDYFAYQGNPAITGSRDAAREAFAKGLITDGQGWMDMIARRNQSVRTYNEATADAIVEDIDQRFLGLFAALAETLETLADAQRT